MKHFLAKGCRMAKGNKIETLFFRSSAKEVVRCWMVERGYTVISIEQVKGVKRIILGMTRETIKTSTYEIFRF